MSDAVLIVLALCVVAGIVVWVMRGRIDKFVFRPDGIDITRHPGEAIVDASTSEGGSITAKTQGGKSAVLNSKAANDIIAKS